MTEEQKQSIALMRYAAISPLVSGLTGEYKSLSAYFKEAASKSYTGPDEKSFKFAPETIESWYRDYLKEGFNALIPRNRNDRGRARSLNEDSMEFIKHMKLTYPRMPATQIYRQMLAQNIISKNEVSEATVNRYINKLMTDEHLTNHRDMRRYERPHINEVWCGDTTVLPPRFIDTDGKKHKLFVIALIDDASRMIVGADVFFNDNFINLMSVEKSAMAKYGKPKILNFDNGSSFKNKQMELLAARVGITLNYDHPYTPTEKAKIERWFLTLKNQWCSTLDMKDFKSLDDVRTSLNAYVDKYNNTVHSSLKGHTPTERYFSEPDCFHRLSEDQIDYSFLLEIERTVSADSVIVIDKTEYEVDYRFSGQRIKLRYSPDFSEIYVVEDDGSLTPTKFLDKHQNATIKRDKVYLSKGEQQ